MTISILNFNAGYEIVAYDNLINKSQLKVYKMCDYITVIIKLNIWEDVQGLKLSQNERTKNLPSSCPYGPRR